jgi:hypothetical protein
MHSRPYSSKVGVELWSLAVVSKYRWGDLRRTKWFLHTWCMIAMRFITYILKKALYLLYSQNMHGCPTLATSYAPKICAWRFNEIKNNVHISIDTKNSYYLDSPVNIILSTLRTDLKKTTYLRITYQCVDSVTKCEFILLTPFPTSSKIVYDLRGIKLHLECAYSLSYIQ